MASLKKECLDEALAALRNFSREDLDDYAHEVFAKMNDKPNLSSQEAMTQAIEEVNKEMLQSFFEDASIKASNIDKYERDAAALRRNKKDYNLRAQIAKRHVEAGNSIEAAQQTASNELYRHVFSDFNHEETEFITSPENSLTVADIFDGKEVDHPMGKKIADRIKSYFEYRNTQLVTSHAMKMGELNKDRLFMTVHDPVKIVSGAKNFINGAKDILRGNLKKPDMTANKVPWREFLKKFLDIQKTFGRTKAIDENGVVNENSVNTIMDNSFDNITTNKSAILTRSSVVSDREAVAKKSKLFYIFKGLRAQLEYSKVYGHHSNLLDLLQSDIIASGRQIGLARKWGDSPYKMYNDLRKVQMEVDPTKTPKWYANTDDYLKVAMGLDSQTVSPTRSNFLANIRVITSMARGVKIGFTSVSDIGYQSAFGQQFGLGYFRTFLNNLTHLFDTFSNEERKRIAKLYKLSTDSHLGYMGRWTDAYTSSDILNKVSSQFFKRTLLTALDRGNKVSIMHLIAKTLFEQSGKKLSALGDQLQTSIRKFIDESEWDLLRGKNQGSLFTVENVDALSESELRAHWETTDKKFSLHEYRNDLYRRVDQLFMTASEHSVLSPAYFERAFMYRGEAAGTFKGDLLRQLWHFRSYTVSFIDRVLIQGFKNADGAQQKLAWAMGVFMGTLPASILTMYLGNLADGKSMPDFNAMNAGEKEKFLVELFAPSLALFSSILNKNNQNSNIIWTPFNNPSNRFIGLSIASAAALITGDTAGAKRNAEKAIQYMLPIQDVPIASPMLRQAMGEQAYLEPGQREYRFL